MKKRVILLFLCMILAVSLILPCGALSVAPSFEISSYSMYSLHIASAYLIGRVPDNFVHYRQISALGKFEGYTSPSIEGFIYCSYHLSDSVDNFSLSVDIERYMDDILDDPNFITPDRSKINVEEIADLSHMVSLKRRPLEEAKLYVATIGDIKYYYHYPYGYAQKYPDAPPLLFRIVWWHDMHYYRLYDISDYPAGQDTLVGRLLNYETAEAAVNELMADVDGDYEMPAEDWHLIGSGILFWTAAIALPIVIIKRKRKKAALAGGGEDGMDDAGEDVESANKSDSGGEETDSGGVKISGGENADISRDDTVPNPPTDPG